MKKITYFRVFILCSFFTLFSLAEAAEKPTIYVLKSSGICDGCSEAISKMLFTEGIQSQILGPAQLKKHVTTNDLLIVGGGIPGGEESGQSNKTSPRWVLLSGSKNISQTVVDI